MLILFNEKFSSLNNLKACSKFDFLLFKKQLCKNGWSCLYQFDIAIWAQKHWQFSSVSAS